MAAKTEWICPICCVARDVAYVMACLHKFCLGCILRWANLKSECPLCYREIETVRFFVNGQDDYLKYVVTTFEYPDASSLAGRSPSCPTEKSLRHPVLSPPSSAEGRLSPAQQGAAGPEAVAGLLPEVWATLFQGQMRLLDPMLPWLRQQLEALYGARWWQARSVESTILHILCLCGPDEGIMVQVLQPSLEEYTAPLVHGLINVIVCRCSEEARRLLRSDAAEEEEEEDSPSDSSSCTSSSCTSASCTSSQEGTPDSSRASSSSPAGSEAQEEGSISAAALRGGPGRSASAPIPTVQVQPQVKLRQTSAAGHSASGCTRCRSAPGSGWDCSTRARRRPRNRRAPSPQTSPQPCNSLPCRQH
ncbi:TOPRS ligase, partial [Steatornis caripensis]|nr:TOPRS ligase [Steatornis caripensis]